MFQAIDVPGRRDIDTVSQDCLFCLEVVLQSLGQFSPTEHRQSFLKGLLLHPLLFSLLSPSLVAIRHQELHTGK